MTPVSHLRYTSIALAAAGLALACAGLARAATDDSKGPVVYRWTDENGVVHYGDRVPPQYSQRETTVLNNQGVVIGEMAAQKTPAELAQAAREEQQQEQQKQRDSFLLTTYASVADIEQLRDERIGQLKGQLVASEQYIATLHDRLLALQAQAMLYKPYNPQPSAARLPDDLAEQLVRTLNEMRDQHKALAAKGQEEAVIRAQFQADIDRFRELRSASASRDSQ